MNQKWKPYLPFGRAPIFCRVMEFFSKLNSIKTKEVERLGEVVHYLQGVHLIYIFYKYNNKI